MASTENATNHKKTEICATNSGIKADKKTIFLFKLISISRAIRFEGKAKNLKTLKLLEFLGCFENQSLKFYKKSFE